MKRLIAAALLVGLTGCGAPKGSQGGTGNSFPVEYYMENVDYRVAYFRATVPDGRVVECVESYSVNGVGLDCLWPEERIG